MLYLWIFRAYNRVYKPPFLLLYHSFCIVIRLYTGVFVACTQQPSSSLSTILFLMYAGLIMYNSFWILLSLAWGLYLVFFQPCLDFEGHLLSLVIPCGYLSLEIWRLQRLKFLFFLNFCFSVLLIASCWVDDGCIWEHEQFTSETFTLSFCLWVLTGCWLRSYCGLYFQGYDLSFSLLLSVYSEFNFLQHCIVFEGHLLSLVIPCGFSPLANWRLQRLQILFFLNLCFSVLLIAYDWVDDGCILEIAQLNSETFTLYLCLSFSFLRFRLFWIFVGLSPARVVIVFIGKLLLHPCLSVTMVTRFISFSVLVTSLCFCRLFPLCGIHCLPCTLAFWVILTFCSKASEKLAFSDFSEAILQTAMFGLCGSIYFARLSQPRLSVMWRTCRLPNLLRDTLIFSVYQLCSLYSPCIIRLIRWSIRNVVMMVAAHLNWEFGYSVV